MILDGKQRKIYALALAILLAVIGLVSAWLVFRREPSQDTAATVMPTESASVTEMPTIVLQPTPTAAETGAVATFTTVVYYQDNYGYLVPVMCNVPLEKGVAKATLNMMVKSPENDMMAARMGLRTVLPEGVSMDLDIANGTARIDLSKEALEMSDAAQESAMVNAVVQTLTEFPTVKEVEFLIDGQARETLTHGTSVSGKFRRGAINLESISVSSTLKDAKTVTLYFPGDSQTVLVPITRVVYQDPDINTAVLELTKGPSKDSALSEVIPSDCGLVDVTVEDRVAKLQFTGDFAAILNAPDGGRLALKALVMTCTQFEGVDAVEIYVDGVRFDIGEDVPTFMNIADEIVYAAIQAQASRIFEDE